MGSVSDSYYFGIINAYSLFLLVLSQSFVKGQQFFEKYESSHQALLKAAELYIKADNSGTLHKLNNNVFYMYIVLPKGRLRGSLNNTVSFVLHH